MRVINQASKKAAMKYRAIKKINKYKKNKCYYTSNKNNKSNKNNIKYKHNTGRIRYKTRLINKKLCT